MNIRTLEGTMTAHESDWVVQGVQGEFYPVKPDIFTATYEPVTLWPFPCCDHCECPPHSRDGHDDTCMHGCNDAPPPPS